MDLQTYIIWRYGTGYHLKPSTMSALWKRSKRNVKQFKYNLCKYDNLAYRLDQEL